MASRRLELDLHRHLAPFEARRLAFYRFDVLVLGSGVAGASAALAAARGGANVALVTKDRARETNTYYAQGGVAAVLASEDSFEAHVADTLSVGCGLSEPGVVEEIVRGGPAAIERLIELGADFDRLADGRLDLSREGGHSQHRIVHARGAATGIEIQETLGRAVEAAPELAVFEHVYAVDLLTAAPGTAEPGQVIGVLCRTARDELVAFSASQVILATGGAGQVYRETTNPSIATGDGVAMAFRAGAALRDLEFFQFHPTCLYIAGAARVLISEIVRGAGGILLDRSGVRFMPEYHPGAELAPRDVVSRACFDRMVKTNDTNVYLDLSDLERDPHELFPGISRICHHFAIDIARDPIPVRPGAHYMIGGVQVDTCGRTNLPGLWAVGECASTGLHGANRMGSNSLLEGLVMGQRAGELAATESRARAIVPLDRDLTGRDGERSGDVRVGIQDMTYSLKSLMWRQLGIVRRAASLEDAVERISFWTRAVLRLAKPEPRAFELLNMLTLARLMAHSALFREESRGTHFREDFPEPSDAWLAHTVLRAQAGSEGHGSGGGIEGVELDTEPMADVAALR